MITQNGWFKLQWATTRSRENDGNVSRLCIVRHEVDCSVLSLTRLPRAALHATTPSNISLVICLIQATYCRFTDYCGITEGPGLPSHRATPQLSRNRRFGRIQRPHQRGGILPDADNAPLGRLPSRRLARWPVQDGPGAPSLPTADRPPRGLAVRKRVGYSRALKCN